ncbi:ABC transporter ATP-binding protein [Mesorhizobium sp. CO1-1-8]|uniref:ABC transporter ATP-binding protein n=1 Tax=Mesorhizobium sp. CO1-1-8 TaxID=2876631 RepID=UPI001CD11F77|nr:ABC transporter ATP-binding protein [Mesorhizobium sp. CO1-1-8]MBZ9772380.1 ABC transporter ATP-binding protein [Mesorhizobium sp. CO1-1-8]
MSTTLSVQNLSKSFAGLKAVQKMSLEAKAGEIAAVIGPNGAGKTTLFNCITGAIQPDQAEIKLSAQDAKQPVLLQRKSMEEIARLGVARTFQQVRLFDSLSLVDNVVLGGLYRHQLGWGEILVDRLGRGARRHRALRTQAEQYLRRVGLQDQRYELAGNLDHGNRRRLEIARALAGHPVLLLLDEPAAGLNRIETDRLTEILAGLSGEGMAILLIEHDMKLVMRIASRIYVMDHGELLTCGSADEVASDARVIEAYLGSRRLDEPRVGHVAG